MAANFIGLIVQVTLSNPPGEKVRGTVKDVGAGQQLTLASASSVTTGEYHSTLAIPATNVLELDIEVGNPTLPVVKESVVDPAIVSFERRNVQDGVLNEKSSQLASSDFASTHPPIPTRQPTTTTTIQSRASTAVEKTVEQVPAKNSSPVNDTNGIDITPSATLHAPFSDLSLHTPTNGTETGLLSSIPEQDGKAMSTVRQATSARTDIFEPKKQSKRGKRAGRPRPDLAKASKGVDPSTNKSSKDFPTWEAGMPSKTPAIERGKRRKGRYKASDHEDQNGWATGEATDIQEMGDFDFEENLSKFDKRKVFNQIRQDDTTADEDRLHSFNRRPRPGTAGGRNLHYTENVLDSPKLQIAEHSSEDDEIGISDNRRGSDRGGRRILTRKPPSRQGSGISGTNQHMTGSGSLADIRESRPISALSSSIAAPMTMSKSLSRSRKSSAQPPKSTLRLCRSNRNCPCVSPLQMLELEQLAISELGLTEDMMTENAGRCIAETALSIIHAANESSNPGDRHPPPLIIFLCGNTKTGSRAIAAARHLRNHSARVVLCLLGLEREDDLLENVRRQLSIYRNCGGRIVRQDQLMRTLHQLRTLTDLIVDAMLGMHLSFDDLRTDDQAAFFELVYWVNEGYADVLSIDLPSGIDASTGMLTQHDDVELGIMADHILSLGAPKTGLLNGQFEELYRDYPYRDFRVADIGVPGIAWKRCGKRGRYGVEFRGEWVVRVDYWGGLE